MKLYCLGNYIEQDGEVVPWKGIKNGLGRALHPEKP